MLPLDQQLQVHAMLAKFHFVGMHISPQQGKGDVVPIQELLVHPSHRQRRAVILEET